MLTDVISVVGAEDYVSIFQGAFVLKLLDELGHHVLDALLVKSVQLVQVILICHSGKIVNMKDAGCLRVQLVTISITYSFPVKSHLVWVEVRRIRDHQVWELAVVFLLRDRMACSGMGYGNVRSDWCRDDEERLVVFDGIIDVPKGVVGDEIGAVAVQFLWLVMPVAFIVLEG